MPHQATGSMGFMAKLEATAPIGVFDSGVGGLSILSGIHELLPTETLHYVADSAHAPYGPKGEAFIRERCEAIMTSLLRLEVKAVVVACNTATAAAVAQMRDRYDLPIIGVEPAIKPAAEHSKSGVVGVLATSGTIASDKFLSLQSRFAQQVQILTRACPGLVELIEQVAPDTHELDGLLRVYIAPLLERGADTLVLGCTHYSLIRSRVQRIAGADVRIVDAGSAVAKELQRRLVMHGLTNTEDRTGLVCFHTSGDLEQQNKLLAHYWGKPVHSRALD
jgi:glutamate racemase